MEQGQDHDRTEPASQWKLEEAHKRGQVAKSLDINSTAMVLGMAAAFLIWGDETWRQLAGLWAELLGAAGAGEGLGAAVALDRLFGILVLAVGPVIAVAVLLAVLGNLLQTGPVLSAFPLKPRFDRLNPVQGFKRIFNRRILVEAVKSLLKLVLFGGILAYSLSVLWPALPALESATPAWQGAWLAAQTEGLVLRLAAAMAAVALLDWVWSRFEYARQMRMSRREQREELKRREGDPLLRAKLRELQRANLKQAKSMGRVKDADVVITNPQHLSVALRYVRGEMEAPEVVAKGADHWAAAIRRLALSHGVPVLERRALARSLHARATVGERIPAEDFLEVARLYATLGAPRSGAASATVMNGPGGAARSGGAAG